VELSLFVFEPEKDSPEISMNYSLHLNIHKCVIALLVVIVAIVALCVFWH
jgi:hypothetical protein